MARAHQTISHAHRTGETKRTTIALKTGFRKSTVKERLYDNSGVGRTQGGGHAQKGNIDNAGGNTDKDMVAKNIAKRSN